MKSLRKNLLEVSIFDSCEMMAAKAAEDFRNSVAYLLQTREEINIIFSGAESQELFLKYLAEDRSIAWNRINAFAVDEFVSPGMNPEIRVCSQPERLLYSRVKMKSVSIINHEAEDIEEERYRYEEIIRNNKPDIACLGIGKSGHIAFNEPGQSSFTDNQLVRIISVHPDSNAQLMADPNFNSVGSIPQKAITITIPPLMECPIVSIVTPYAIKAEVIKHLMESEVDESFPASILQTKKGARLYLDQDSFSLCKDIK